MPRGADSPAATPSGGRPPSCRRSGRGVRPGRSALPGPPRSGRPNRCGFRSRGRPRRGTLAAPSTLLRAARAWPRAAGDRPGGGFSANFVRSATSSGVRRRDSPDDRPRSVTRPIRVRTSSRTPWPSRASTRRTWRLRPSRIVTSTSDRDLPPLRRRTRAPPVLPSDKYTPRTSRRISSPVTWPATVARYVLGTSNRGWARRLANSPSLVMRSAPRESASSRPTGNRRARDWRMKSIGRGRPDGSRFVHTTPSGLLKSQYSGRSGRSRDPSSRTSCASGSALAPGSATTRPSTVTRPAAMISSQALREATPARARSF